MKLKHFAHILVGTLLATGSVKTQAQSTYVKADAGPTFTQDVSISGTDDKARFDIGSRVDVSFGYVIAPSLSLELETGVLQTHIPRIGAGVVIPPAPPADPYETGHADLTQIPILLNLNFDIPTGTPIKPYITVGAGGMASMLDGHFPGGNVRDTDFTFAYQASAGVRYEVLKNMEVGLGYKFLGSPGHTWTDNGFSIGTRSIFTHSVVAVFLLRF